MNRLKSLDFRKNSGDFFVFSAIVKIYQKIFLCNLTDHYVHYMNGRRSRTSLSGK